MFVDDTNLLVNACGFWAHDRWFRQHADANVILPLLRVGSGSTVNIGPSFL